MNDDDGELRLTSAQQLADVNDRVATEGGVISKVEQLQLPFTCYDLIIPIESDNCSVLEAQKELFRGGENDWYHISIFDMEAQHSVVWGFVSHAALSCLQAKAGNSGTAAPTSSASLAQDTTVRSTWRVPKDLCVSDVSSPLHFSYYQCDADAFESKLAALTEQKLADAFVTRLHLYHWISIQADSAARDRFRRLQPRRVMDRINEMAAVSDKCSFLDEVVYFLSATHLGISNTDDREKQVADFWLQSETELLSHKLMRHPHLSGKLLQLMGSATGASTDETVSCNSSSAGSAAAVVKPTPSMSSLQSLRLALASVPGFHRRNLTDRAVQANALRILESIPEALARAFERITAQFLGELLQRAVVSRIVNPPPRSAPVNVHSKMDFGDSLDCSPACMQRIMNRAILGDDATKARATVTERNVLIAYMYEQHFGRAEVGHLVRPHNQVAYENEEPEQSVQAIETAVGNADPSKSNALRALQPDYDRIIPRHTVELQCSYSMSNDLCFHRNLESLKAPVSATTQLSPHAQKAQNAQLNAAAKRSCQQQLGETHTRRRAQPIPLSSGKQITNQWPPTPSNYTTVAFRGDEFNEAYGTPTPVTSTSKVPTPKYTDYRIRTNRDSSSSSSAAAAAATGESQKRKHAETMEMQMEARKKSNNPAYSGEKGSGFDW